MAAVEGASQTRTAKTNVAATISDTEEAPSIETTRPGHLFATEFGPRAPRVSDVLALQRSIGNAHVTALLGARAARLQREPAAAPPATDRQSIDRALKSGQYFDLAGVKNFGSATDQERVTLSGICISTGFTAPQDANESVFQLWSGMGERLPTVVRANEAEWDRATKFCPRLTQLPVVLKAQEDFRNALRSLADGNLQENQRFVQERKQRLGLGEQGEPLKPEEMTQLRQGIQKTAWHAWELKQQQGKYRQMVVGYAGQNLGFGTSEWHFDPARPPPVKGTLFSTPPQKHDDVKEAWDTAENELADIGNEYPEIYAAAAADEQGNALLQLSRVVPENFGETVKQNLLALEKRIQEVRDSIGKGELNLLDLGLLHEAVFQGGGSASARNWQDGFDKWAAKRLIADRKQDKAAVHAILKTVEVTAMVVGTFAGGLGRLAATGVAVGVEMFMAGKDMAEANRLQQASRTTPLKGTALVSRVEADAKKAEAVVAMVQAMTFALLAGGAAVSMGLRAIRLKALVPDVAQLARLRELAKNDAALEELLRKLNNPTAVEGLLVEAGSIERAKELLRTRELFRQRFAERYSKDIAEVQKLKAQIPELAKIPDEELLAIRGYTAEDYDMVNRVLRAGKADAEMARLQPYIDNVKSGLDRFPDFRGVVTRTESNTHMLYQQGETVTMSGFTSTCGPGGKVTKQIVGNTSLEIESLTGKDIRAITAHPKEAEVLFAPGKKFLVVSKTKPLPTAEWYKVRLREVP